jgi:hypothetical protein
VSVVFGLNPPNILVVAAFEEANGFALGASDLGANGFSLDFSVEVLEAPNENPELFDDPNNPALGSDAGSAGSVFTWGLSSTVSAGVLLSLGVASCFGANPSKLKPDFGFSLSVMLDSASFVFSEPKIVVSVLLDPKLNPEMGLAASGCFLDETGVFSNPNRFVFKFSGGGVFGVAEAYEKDGVGFVFDVSDDK